MSASSSANYQAFSTIDTQDVVRYCESHLRAALNSRLAAKAEKAAWVHSGMISELVSSTHMVTLPEHYLLL